MASDDLILNALDVIEIRSDTDLIITSNSHIKLSTTNILVNYIPLESYIRKLLSPATVLSGVTSHSNVHTDYGAPIANITGLDQLNNNDEDTEMDIDTVFCRGNFADSSYVLTPDSVNVQHYINISAANNIYFKHESFDDNILFHKYDQSPSGSSLQTLKDYIYSVVHAIERPGSVPPQIFDPIDYRKNLEHLGNFSGRKIICKKITTNETELRDIEPVLTFDSKTAINFYTDTSSNAGSMGIGSKIYFGNDASSGTDTSLDQLIYDQRSVGLAIAANFTPGLDIIMDVTTITETPRTGFPYDIMFNIYEHVNVYDPVLYPTLLENYMAIPSGSANTFKVPNVLLDTDVPSIPNFTFTNLKPGKFYTVVARTTNLRTNTVSYVFVEPPNQPTIKHVYEITVTVIDEETIKIQFRGHDTVVSDWSTPGKQIKFSVSVDGYSGEIDTSLRQDMSGSPADITLKTYDLSVSSIPSYGNILRVNNSFQTVGKTINIISNHIEVGSTFELSQSASMIFFTFQAPTNAPSLSIHYVNKQLTWTHANDANDRLKNIYFELYKDLTKIQDNSSKIYDGLGESSVGSWTVKAKNAYGQLSGVSITINIVTLAISTLALESVFHLPRQFKFAYSISSRNNQVSITGTGISNTTPTTAMDGFVYTEILHINTPQTSFEITFTDSMGFSLPFNRSITSYLILPTLPTGSISIVDPNTIDVSIGSYIGNTGVFYLSNSSSSNSQPVEFLPSSNYSLPNTPNTINFGGTYYLWGKITSSQGFEITGFLNAQFTRPHIPPTAPVINESLTNNISNKTPTSINVYFSLESNGSYSMSSFKIEYKLSGTSSFTTATTLTSSPYNILGLNHHENYDIKISKTYPAHTMDDTVYSIRTNLGTLPSYNIGISSEYRYDAHGRYEIQFSWTSGDDGNPAETLQETRVYYRQGGGDEYINNHIPSLPGDYVVVTNGANYVGSFPEASYNFRFVKMYNIYNLVIASDNIPFNFITITPSFAYITMVECIDTNSTQESYRITYEHETQTAFHKLQIWNFFGENTPTSEVTLVNDTSTYMKVYETYTYYSERTINIIIPFYNNPPTFYIRVLTPSLQSYSQSAIQIVRLIQACVYYSTNTDYASIHIKTSFASYQDETIFYEYNSTQYELIGPHIYSGYNWNYYYQILFANNPYIHYSNNGHLIIKRQLSYTNDDGIDINIFTTNMRLLRGCSQPTNHVLSKDPNNYLRITFNIPSYLGEFILRDLTYKISWEEAVRGETGSQIRRYEEDYIAIDDSTSITLTSLYTIHARAVYVVQIYVRARDFPFNPFTAYVSKKGSEIVI